MDYSESLVKIARTVIPNADLLVDEAVNMPVDKYDWVVSDSVFAYFKSEEYALQVLEKMYDKANNGIAILEVFDADLEKECIKYRKSKVSNYEERYEGLDKMFYRRQMFESFAETHNCRITFEDVKNEFYWNSKYMYNVYIKKE